LAIAFGGVVLERAPLFGWELLSLVRAQNSASFFMDENGKHIKS
jgi:hypothetical protein